MHHFHILTDEDGAVLGRVSLVGFADGSAEIGYRIAGRAAGRGGAGHVGRPRGMRTGFRGVRPDLTPGRDDGGQHGFEDRTGPCGSVETGAVTLLGRPGLRFTRDLTDPDR